MAEEGFKRKLTAILSADVEGYSRLMGDDEEATVRTLTSYREVLSTLIQQHNGIVLDSPGDNLLAEFVSVVDAVQCAVAVQKEIHARNEELPENRRMQFRIGINLGDVIQEKGRIYGDGVNIAARLESLAEPGGICISKTAFDHIENKLPYGYEFLGDQTVKNISKPVGAYRVVLEPRVTMAGEAEKIKPLILRRKAYFIGATAVLVLAVAIGFWQFYTRRPSVEPASEENMAFSLPNKPSIAVLPFDNMSGDQKQEYIANGITENIITTLSKLSGLFVISRNSSFSYKGKPVKVQQVSEELGVRYVLEGSVQRSGDQVRVIAQLIDAIDGKHLWSERYDRNFKDIFELQDELTSKIVVSLRITLSGGAEGHKLTLKNRPSNLQYNEKLFEANDYLSQLNKEANIKAKQLFREAIDLEPEYFGGYTGLAYAHFMDVHLGLSSSPGKSLGEAVKLCKKAITLDETQDWPHIILGHIYGLFGKFDKAIAEGERAIALNPNSAPAYDYLAWTLTWAGRAEEAINLQKKAQRLNPKIICSLGLGNAYRELGQYDEALIEYKKCAQKNPKNIFAHENLAETYALAGRYEEARDAWSEVLKIDPKETVERAYKICLYGPDNCARKIAAMHKAGIK